MFYLIITQDHITCFTDRHKMTFIDEKQRKLNWICNRFSSIVRYNNKMTKGYIWGGETLYFAKCVHYTCISKNKWIIWFKQDFYKLENAFKTDYSILIYFLLFQ